MKATLLLVEDDADARELLGRALERAGYACLVAQNASEALEQARTAGRCDLVITDIVLGNDDRGGLDLMARLRAIGVTAPTVLITAFADVEKVKFGLNHGAAHLLEKPFRSAELVEVIQLLLERKPSPATGTERVLRAAALTEKELTVARHLLEGLSSAEIAQLELNSAKTIRQHVSRIYAKFGVKSRAEFFRFVYSDRVSAS
jgi:DNA-binding NarL/FixJ family response regulator